MNHLRFGLVAAMIALLGGSQALAHHSFAMFDNTKTITLDGTVKSFEFTNPHSWLQVVVPEANGRVTEWSLELNALVGLRRGGWKPTTIRAGDKVKVAFHPIRDGSNAGQLSTVTLPGGAVMNGQANGPHPQPPPGSPAPV